MAGSRSTIIASSRRDAVMRSYGLSIRLSLTTALIGGIFGFLLAWAVSIGGLGAKAALGLVDVFRSCLQLRRRPSRRRLHLHPGPDRAGHRRVRATRGRPLRSGFSLYSFWGLTLVYLYFQIPLMVLVILPALDGLKQDWREAAENLGATPGQYWRQVALPVLLPSILGTMILLFGNAFGAHATAYALTGGLCHLATLLIGQQISGDVLNNPGLGYAVAMGMVLIMAALDRDLQPLAAAIGEVAAMTIATTPASVATEAPTGRTTGQAKPVLGLAVHRVGGRLLPGPAGRHVLLVTAGGEGQARLGGLSAPLRRLQLLPGVHPIDGQRRCRHRPQPADHRPHRLLGHAADAKAAARRGVHHLAPVRDPAGGPGLRPHPPLQPSAAAATSTYESPG